MPRIKKSKAEDLSKREYEQCNSLCYRQGGEMMYDLWDCRQNNIKSSGTVYMIKDDNRLLSWALVKITDMPEQKSCIQVYTRKSERRKGLGRKLIQAIEKDFDSKELVVGIHDKLSEKFYAETNYIKDYITNENND